MGRRRTPATVAEAAVSPDVDAQAVRPAEDMPEPPKAPTAPEPAKAQSVPKAAAAKPPPPTPAPKRSGSGVLYALVALILGLGGGYLLSRDGGPLSTGQLDKLVTEQAALQAKLSATESELGALKTALAATPKPSDLADLSARIDTLDAAVAAAKADRAQMAANITELAKPADLPENPWSQEAVAAYERELSAMHKMVQDEIARIQSESAAATAKAAAAARASVSAQALAVLNEIAAALDNGEDFSAALDDLGTLDGDAPVSDLRPYQGGIPTLAELQGSFSDAARAALAADAAAGETTGGIGGFLRTQLGMRSLSPKQGQSTDAVLSRAQAAVQEGDLAKALAEIATLDAPAADAMSDWRTNAETRTQAQAAYAALAAKVQTAGKEQN